MESTSYSPLPDAPHSPSACSHEFAASVDVIDDGAGAVVEPVEEPLAVHEIRVREYTFRGPTPGQAPGVMQGEMCPSYGGRPIAVTAKAIGHDDLEDFLANEGRAYHVLHNYPHPGFAKLRATVESDGDDADGTSYLVLDSMDVNLETHIRERGPISEDSTRLLFRQLVSAVSHAHNHSVALRHIRLQKLYFTDKKRTQLVFADLQGAVVSGACDGSVDASMVDVYALGVVLHVMLTGVYPFNCGSEHDDEGSAVSAPLEFPRHAMASAAACALINRMFDDDSTVRPTVGDLLEDPWLCQSPPVQSFGRFRSPNSSRRMAVMAGEEVLPLSAAAMDAAPSLGRRRRSVVIETDMDQVVPEVLPTSIERTRGDSPKRKATPVPQLLPPPVRQRISLNDAVVIAPHSLDGSTKK